MPDVIWIASVRDPDGQPVCELTWGDQTWCAPVADVRQTAVDLLSCAAYAEWIHLLVTKVGLPPADVKEITLDLMRIGGRTRDHGTDATVDLVPASGTRDDGGRESVVLLRRGDTTGMISLGAAREMAMHWLAAAEATESDQLVAEAYRAVRRGDDAGLDRLFGYLRKLRNHGGIR
jgi:hypothetical protein